MTQRESFEGHRVVNGESGQFMNDMNVNEHVAIRTSRENSPPL